MLESQEIEKLKEDKAPSFAWQEETLNSKAHFVQFYHDDAFLIHSLKEFVSRSESSIVVATPEHIDLLKQSLDSDTAQTILFLDAAETLSQFMVHGRPDPDLFSTIIGALIINATKNNTRVHIYGEMVSLLWAEGNQNAALELEKLWNDLQATHSFSLLCGYPLNYFNGHEHSSSFENVCTHHSKVLPAESYPSDQNLENRLHAIALLQQKASSLKAELEKTQKLERQKDEFLALVSHELKTPLTSIKIYGQVLHDTLQKKSDTQSTTYLSKMDAQIHKLSELVNDLLDVTRVQAGKLTFNYSTFDIQVLLSETIHTMQLTTDRHTIESMLGQKCALLSDPDRINQVVSNLISNAIKYSPASEKIIVTCSMSAHSLCISVQDFGIGMLPSDQEKIFDQFFRSEDPDHVTFPGLGLGLFISQEIAKRLNGTITVESKKGIGSTFYFTIPI